MIKAIKKFFGSKRTVSLVAHNVRMASARLAMDVANLKNLETLWEMQGKTQEEKVELRRQWRDEAMGNLTGYKKKFNQITADYEQF